MATKKTVKTEAIELMELFKSMYGSNDWFYGAYLGVDDLGPHVDLWIDVPAFLADGYKIPGAPNSVKVSVFDINKNGKKPKKNV